MGLIGTTNTVTSNNNQQQPTTMWSALKEFSATKPTWGTCAGRILLAERCVGASAVIQDGQALVGGMDVLVCRNYFGSQVSSFEMAVPPPPTTSTTSSTPNHHDSDHATVPDFPGVFIRAPAILSAASNVQVLGKVVAQPCRQAAVVLQELENKLAKGENVIVMGVVDALNRTRKVDNETSCQHQHQQQEEDTPTSTSSTAAIVLPGAANGSHAREVICAVQRDNLLCTAFHPELTDDYRWHEYFVDMVRKAKKQEEAKKAVS